jgi:hypothetical protein
MKRVFPRYLLCLLLFNLGACSSMQTVDVESAMQNATARGVEYGSLVHVETLDHQKVKFRVTEMTNEGLGGNRGFYRFEDMLSLKVEKTEADSSDNALAWVLGALAVGALVFLVANADSVSVCSGQPCPRQ